jgi:D-glycero-D-manno-heptose 1,7-bisphosphate phosphatase
MMRLVILDRDGVINADSDAYIKSHHEWEPLPGSLEAVARLTQNGVKVVVATNQSGLGRGLFDMSALNEMHAKMHRALALHGGKVDAVFVCPHTPEDGCTCRKPKPGLFEQIAKRYDFDLKGTPLVGDSHRDLAAGAAAGCVLMLVRTGKGIETAKRDDLPPGTLVFDDLAGAVDHIISHDLA